MFKNARKNFPKIFLEKKTTFNVKNAKDNYKNI